MPSATREEFVMLCQRWYVVPDLLLNGGGESKDRDEDLCMSTDASFSGFFVGILTSSSVRERSDRCMHRSADALEGCQVP